MQSGATCNLRNTYSTYQVTGDGGRGGVFGVGWVGGGGGVGGRVGRWVGGAVWGEYCFGGSDDGVEWVDSDL